MTFVQRIDPGACGCDAPDAAAGIVSIDEALARISEHVVAVAGTARVALADAAGRVLAEPVRALSDMPRFDHSAMDGFALRREDLVGPGPWRLPVTMRRAAGDRSEGPLVPGSAARIFTGAPVPAGADCVIMQEEVEHGPGAIRVARRPARHENIRFRGEEFAEGSAILSADTLITARAVAVAASAGFGSLEVRRRVRVALLVTGSEVAQPGTTDLDAARIWDVNTPMLQAALGRASVEIVACDVLPDTVRDIEHALVRAARISDLVITTGGVSVGEEDHLCAAVRRAGGDLRFSGVSVKPGKPVSFGRIGATAWLGLPGNPQSAFVTWTLFGEAILRRLSGLGDADMRKRFVVLSHPVERKPGRCEIRPASLIGHDGTGRERVACLNPVQSGQVGALSTSDGLVFLPSDAGHLPRGALVEFLPFCSTQGST
jgi:molybdopterin molybdotransferase